MNRTDKALKAAGLFSKPTSAAKAALARGVGLYAVFKAGRGSLALNLPPARTIVIRATKSGMVFVTSEDEPTIFIATRSLPEAVDALAAVVRKEP
jgi:hypothetical protein